MEMFPGGGDKEGHSGTTHHLTDDFLLGNGGLPKADFGHPVTNFGSLPEPEFDYNMFLHEEHMGGLSGDTHHLTYDFLMGNGGPPIVDYGYPIMNSGLQPEPEFDYSAFPDINNDPFLSLQEILESPIPSLPHENVIPDVLNIEKEPLQLVEVKEEPFDEPLPPIPAQRRSPDHSRPRLQWSMELHMAFLRAVKELGGGLQATPKSVWRIMNVPGLSLYNVKSHLQKYRQANGLVGASRRAKKKGTSGSQVPESSSNASSSKAVQTDEPKRKRSTAKNDTRVNDLQMTVNKQLDRWQDAQRNFFDIAMQNAHKALNEITEDADADKRSYFGQDFTAGAGTAGPTATFFQDQPISYNNASNPSGALTADVLAEQPTSFEAITGTYSPPKETSTSVWNARSSYLGQGSNCEQMLDKDPAEAFLNWNYSNIDILALDPFYFNNSGDAGT